MERFYYDVGFFEEDDPDLLCLMEHLAEEQQVQEAMYSDYLTYSSENEEYKKFLRQNNVPDTPAPKISVRNSPKVLNYFGTPFVKTNYPNNGNKKLYKAIFICIESGDEETQVLLLSKAIYEGCTDEEIIKKIQYANRKLEKQGKRLNVSTPQHLDDFIRGYT